MTANHVNGAQALVEQLRKRSHSVVPGEPDDLFATMSAAAERIETLETLVKSLLVHHGCDWYHFAETGESCHDVDWSDGEEPCLQCACEFVLDDDPWGPIVRSVIEEHLLAADRKLPAGHD